MGEVGGWDLQGDELLRFGDIANVFHSRVQIWRIINAFIHVYFLPSLIQIGKLLMQI
jgi:hypothetical protein